MAILVSTCRPWCERTASGVLSWRIEAEAYYGDLESVPSYTRHWMGFTAKYGRWPTRDAFAMYLLHRCPAKSKALITGFEASWASLSEDYKAVTDTLTPAEAVRRFNASASVDSRIKMQEDAGGIRSA